LTTTITTDTKTTLAETVDSILTTYDSGLSVQNTWQKFSEYNFKTIYDIIKSSGKMRPRGAHLKNNPSIKRGKPKTTNDITPEILAAAIKSRTENMGVVAIAKAQNVNPALLSAALKKAGYVITRGKPRKAK